MKLCGDGGDGGGNCVFVFIFFLWLIWLIRASWLTNAYVRLIVCVWIYYYFAKWIAVLRTTVYAPLQLLSSQNWLALYINISFISMKMIVINLLDLICRFCRKERRRRRTKTNSRRTRAVIIHLRILYRRISYSLRGVHNLQTINISSQAILCVSVCIVQCALFD